MKGRKIFKAIEFAANASAEKLTQEILGKPLRGEPVPTEADLARREGSFFEPASKAGGSGLNNQQSKNGTFEAITLLKI